MATGSTVHRLKVELSDVDRGVYAALDVRLARHPSETARYLLTRAIAYCLEYTEGLELGPGLCEPDAAVMTVRSRDGTLERIVEIGVPSAERLHRASKSCRSVVIYCHHDPSQLVRESRERAIHKLDTVVAHAVPAALLDALEPTLERTLNWQVLRSEGHVYVTTGGQTHGAALERITLGE